MTGKVRKRAILHLSACDPTSHFVVNIPGERLLAHPEQDGDPGPIAHARRRESTALILARLQRRDVLQ
jgi:hypothetical protein